MPVVQSSRAETATPAPIEDRLAADLFERSGGSAYGLSLKQFLLVLENVVSRTEGISGSSAQRIGVFLSALKLDELALAHGCAAGNQHAWDVFLTRYRESIYQSARSITRNETTGRELAD